MDLIIFLCIAGLLCSLIVYLSVVHTSKTWVPSCYKTYHKLTPMERAENCCIDCPRAGSCKEDYV